VQNGSSHRVSSCYPSVAEVFALEFCVSVPVTKSEMLSYRKHVCLLQM
jgi:hypothetical protein